jgi:transporter family-2 protein
MQSVVPFIIVGLMGGVAVGLQPLLASLLSHRLGVMESLFIIHIGGAVMVAIPRLVMGGGNPGAWRSVPW